MWWGIETSATADWPVQHRLIEVMDNHDGTLSIFGTCSTTPSPQRPRARPGSRLRRRELASIGREIAYNDPQARATARAREPPTDQNVELLVRDPRLRGYARPKGATPLNIRLVPAFEECISDNASHGAPLSVPSCRPPQQTSDYLTVGTPDANGKAPASMGALTLKEQGESPINTGNGDQADVEITASFTDVLNQGSLTDYTGELRYVLGLRITDRFNGTTGGPNRLEPATSMDVPLPFSVPCSATGGSEGATCSVTTSADAVTGGNAANEGQRAVWQLDQVKVFDGGGDGDADTTGDNTLFAVQGLYAP